MTNLSIDTYSSRIKSAKIYCIAFTLTLWFHFSGQTVFCLGRNFIRAANISVTGLYVEVGQSRGHYLK